MQHILVYADSLSWGIIPDTRQRLSFDQRWPGVLEISLCTAGKPVRVIEHCLNGRRTVFEDPFKPGRNGLADAYQQVCEQLRCAFFDAGSIVTSSRIDGIHLDADQHHRLGKALTPVCHALLSQA